MFYKDIQEGGWKKKILFFVISYFFYELQA